jgi:hypothetical protein
MTLLLSLYFDSSCVPNGVREDTLVCVRLSCAGSG